MMIEIWTSLKISWLVVFRPTPLKNDGVKVSWDYDIPNLMETYISFSKPPTRIRISHVECKTNGFMLLDP